VSVTDAPIPSHGRRITTSSVPSFRNVTVTSSAPFSARCTTTMHNQRSLACILYNLGLYLISYLQSYRDCTGPEHLTERCIAQNLSARKMVIAAELGRRAGRNANPRILTRAASSVAQPPEPRDRTAPAPPVMHGDGRKEVGRGVAAHPACVIAARAIRTPRVTSSGDVVQRIADLRSTQTLSAAPSGVVAATCHCHVGANRRRHAHDDTRAGALPPAKLPTSPTHDPRLGSFPTCRDEPGLHRHGQPAPPGIRGKPRGTYTPNNQRRGQARVERKAGRR